MFKRMRERQCGRITDLTGNGTLCMKEAGLNEEERKVKT
jgi:hypothetical protein